jgi:citronellol/citronellal dehydrogenase
MASDGSRIFAPGLLEGSVCVVSGAGSGLGREGALELARLGATVVGCGRRPEPLAETAAAAESLPGTVEAEAISPKGFRTVIELNVMGTWLMTHAAATKAFIPQEAGKVLSVTLSPHNGMPGMVHSGAARAAVENMMRTLSIEWARFGIKTVSLAAGQFGTDTMRTKYPPEVVAAVPATIPIQRLGTEEEFAWLIAYLASPAGDFFSGTTITIDGARDNWFGSWPPGVYGSSGEPPAEERRPKP